MLEPKNDLLQRNYVKKNILECAEEKSKDYQNKTSP